MIGMNDDTNKQKLEEEIERLQQEVEKLTTERVALDAQRKLLESFVAIARSPVQAEVLKNFLRQTLSLSTQMTKAEKGSLFLLDSLGQLEDAILTRIDSQADQQLRILHDVLDKGLAGWVYRHRKIGLITDTLKDERWLQMPHQPYVARSALCVPIVRGEELLGLLTLLHSQPHRFGNEAVSLMQATADHMSLVLENAQLYGRLKKTSQALDLELEKGRQIQINFLPAHIPKWQGWDIAAYFQPARQLSGDFYDIFELPKKQIGLVVADVCDKGVGAALFMALFRSLIRIFAAEPRLRGNASSILQANPPANGEWIGESQSTNLAHLNPLQAICLINNYVAQYHGDMGMFATLFFGVLEPSTGLLSYISAGHEPLFILNAQGGIKEHLNSTGVVVGVIADTNFGIQQTYLRPGEILLGYTDGVLDARALDGEFFTQKRLLSILESKVSSAQGLLDKIAAEVLEHIGLAAQFDDITMIAVRREG